MERLNSRFRLRHFLFRSWKQVASIEVEDLETGETRILPCSVVFKENTDTSRIVTGRKILVYKDRIIVYTGIHLVCWKFGETLDSFEEIFQQEILGNTATEPFVIHEGIVYIGCDGQLIRFDPVTLAISKIALPETTKLVFTKQMPNFILKNYLGQVLVDRYYQQDVTSMLQDNGQKIGIWLANHIIQNPKSLDVLTVRVVKKINQCLARIHREFPHIMIRELTATELDPIFKNGKETAPVATKFQVGSSFRLTDKREAKFHDFSVFSNDNYIGGFRWYHGEKNALIILENKTCGGDVDPVELDCATEDAYYRNRDVWEPKMINYTIQQYCIKYMFWIMLNVEKMVLPQKLEANEFFLFDGKTFTPTTEPPAEVYH